MMDRSTFTPGPLSEVHARASGDQWTLVFVRTLHHSPAKVWAALTEPAQLAEWAPFTADRDLCSGGDAVLTMIDGEVREAMSATVTRAERPTLLEYTWGTDLLRWELDAVDGGTRLTLRHTLKDHDWLPKIAAGWHLCLDVADRLLSGTPVGPIRGSAARDYGWDELNHAYADKLGIPATDLPESNQP
jgi:uncharacterized protein YndB with AHSA1/START domain